MQNITHSFPYVPGHWDPVFTTFREKFSGPTENARPQEYPNDQYDNPLDNAYQEQEGRSREFITEAARKFMASHAGSGNGPTSIHQTEVVTAFCRQQRSDLSLVPDGKEAHARRVALVYEWQSKPSLPIEQRREYPVPLTYREFMGKLCAPRFADPTNDTNPNQDPTMDADRRIIYINTLDPRTISILSTTTPRLETPVIQRMVFQHLTAWTGVQVHTATRGFKTFSMELSVSYFRLKRRQDSPGLRDFDTRQKWDKTGPLRATLSFPTDPTHHTAPSPCGFTAYETQLSIAVTGVDHYRWTAWGILDEKWFEQDDDLWRFYYGPEDGSQPDPLSAGELDVNPPEPDPRKYFLRIFEIRIGMIAREWEYIVYALKQEIHRVGGNPLFISPEGSFKSKDGREKLRVLAAWNNEMIEMVGTLLDSLSNTLASWDVFQKTDIGCFLDKDTSVGDSSPPACDDENHRDPPSKADVSLASTLHIIQKTFLGLDITHGEMNRLKLRLDDQRRSLARGEEKYSTFVQQRTGEDVKLLTWVTVGWYPVVIATGLCSAQAGIFPFNNNIWDFIFSWLVVTGLLLLTIFIFFYRQGTIPADWMVPSSATSLATSICNASGRAISTEQDTTEGMNPHSRRALSFAPSTRALTKRSRWSTIDSRVSSGAPILPVREFELENRGRNGFGLAETLNSNQASFPLQRVHVQSHNVQEEPTSPRRMV